MGSSNRRSYSKEDESIIKIDEFNIIKNNLAYNIKLVLSKKETIELIKIVISFVINKKFHFYEVYLDQYPQIGKNDNYKQYYQALIEQIKNKNFEIIHENNKGEFILLKLDINQESKSIKLFPSVSDDKTKLNELMKNYISLEENYIRIKKAKKSNQKNNDKSIRKSMESGDENDIIDNDYDF